MNWSGADCDFLSAVWTLILTAPIHCRASIAETLMQCCISPLVSKWSNAKFLKKNSDEETSASWMAWGRVHFWQFDNIKKRKTFGRFENFFSTKLHIFGSWEQTSKTGGRKNISNLDARLWKQRQEQVLRCWIRLEICRACCNNATVPLLALIGLQTSFGSLEK